MREIAQELGMPMIEEYASNCIYLEINSQYERDSETIYTPETL